MTVVYCTQAELVAALASLPPLIDASGDIIDPRHVATGLVDMLAARQKDTTPPAVVVATPTVMGGLILRWFRTASAAQGGEALALATASKSGVTLNGNSYLHDIPAAWIADAQRACEMLQHGQEDRAREMATHQHARVFSGELSEVKR